MDWVISGLLFIFIIGVMIVLRRREGRKQ